MMEVRKLSDILLERLVRIFLIIYVAVMFNLQKSIVSLLPDSGDTPLWLVEIKEKN